IDEALAPWKTACERLGSVASEIEVYRATLESVRKEQRSVDLQAAKSELALLKVRKRRYEQDLVADIEALRKARDRKKAIENQKKEKRSQLTAHTKTVTEGLGGTINAYLDRLGAGFSIDYQQPNYRGTEPSA